MPKKTAGAVSDPYTTSVQWSRRFIGLKLFVSLAHHGASGYVEMIERQAGLGDRLRAGLRRDGWRIVNTTPLPVVCFTHPDLRAGRPAPAAVAAAVQRRGRAWISEAIAGGERVLRACITSFRTTEEDVAALVEEVEAARRG
jgi:glutamate/tyrosine decarboxylase-like PLP-dependent enzyme